MIKIFDTFEAAVAFFSHFSLILNILKNFIRIQNLFWTAKNNFSKVFEYF